MNSKRIRFSFLVLAVYAVLGVVGVYSQSSNSSPEVCVTDIAAIATSVNGGQSDGGGSSTNASLEWHSFLPGAFK
ncbi:MAG: hypothetical protein IPO66_00675 [Rhodanobacteraceae bacterium]|nr:hypothetical protein [Rhodanobacteraceae bacterium]